MRTLSTAPSASSALGRFFFSERMLPPVAALASLLLLALLLLDTAASPVPARTVATTASDTHDAHRLAAQLSQRLVAQTDQRAANTASAASAWALLARTHAVAGDGPAALAAFEQATRAAPHDATLWAERARAAVALASRSGQAWPESARAWVAEALRLNPQEPLALTLAGDWSYAAGNLSGAQRQWQAAQRNAQALPEHGELMPRLQERLASLDAAIAATHQALK
jgi:cytochrome c-type biogenesis protein CcmH